MTTPAPAPAPLPSATPPRTRRPHVVIVGGGFGGLAAAKRLRRERVDVTLVDRTNHHLFQPLLYQVAMATLSPSDIAAPIRWLVRRHENTEVLMAEVEDVDAERRVVRIDDDRREIPYDYLILAAGTRHSYFGHPEWEEIAPGLKSIEDARELRRRFLLAFERAEKTTDPAEREALLTFVIVGAGPTGVELAGIMPTIARETLGPEFRHVDPRRARVLLVEGGPRILPTFPEDLAARAQRDLEHLGVEVRTRAIVTNVSETGATIGDELVPARTIFWAAGNAASGLGRALGAEVDRAGRVRVAPDLSVPGHPELFVIGDLAAATSADGKPVPGVAPAAMQGGRHAADMIRRDLRAQPRVPFRYRNKGDLATIGRNRAIAAFGDVHVTGFAAWLLWLFVHILYLAGFRNRISVLLEWAYAFFTDARGARLITQRTRYNPAPGAAPPVPGWK